jgi:Ser/Thr protein kinase RdoA (MazF antagonist)
MSRDEFFFDLSPDRVLAAVEATGLRPTGHCFALNALENRVYDLKLEDDRHVVAKFYRPGRWSRETIADEHRMLLALRAAEIPVCVPLGFENDETLHATDGVYYAIWPRTGGRAPDELDDEQVQVLGRLLARIHNVGEALGPKHRPHLTSQAVPLRALTLLDDEGFLPPSCARRYRAAVEEAVAVYDQRSRGVPVHAIHGDCHAGNLLHGDQGWFFLDFDDMVIGPAVQDVWMLIPGRDAQAARQRALLVEAYRQFRDFDDRWLSLVEPLRTFRFVFYAGWIARRWEDSVFPDAFPHFGTAQYWETETRDLEELVERIASGRDLSPEGGVEKKASSHDEPELTNKDFFWDL